MMRNKSYLELMNIPTFEERYEYLKLNGVVGRDTFGSKRYINQIFYTSQDWKDVRRDIILRDNGNDLACKGFEICGYIYVHHIETITYEDILQRRPIIFNHNNLITMSLNTHNAIHYSDARILKVPPLERRKNDTCPWR